MYTILARRYFLDMSKADTHIQKIDHCRRSDTGMASAISSSGAGAGESLYLILKLVIHENGSTR
jgi:hypothetical protein